MRSQTDTASTSVSSEEADTVRAMSVALFPHHDWADADGLESPDPELAETGYFHRDPDAFSSRLRGWHNVLWTKQLPNGRRLELQPERGGLRDVTHEEFLSSDAAMPVWERWREVQGFHAEAQQRLQAHGRGTVHDLGWRLYDMGGMILFPGLQVGGLWTINQAKGCTRARIADRLDLTLECIRLYYEFLQHRGTAGGPLPDGSARSNPLGPVLHRYQRSFEIVRSFEGYVDFWMLNDLVMEADAGPQVAFLLPRASSDPYDFTREVALPADADAYCSYLIAADDFVDKRNRRMARVVAELGYDVCPGCLVDSANRDGAHHRAWR